MIQSQSFHETMTGQTHMETPSAPSTQRVRQYRERMRAEGFHTVQFWVPDTSRPEFIAACRAQSRLIQNDAEEQRLNDWMEAVMEDTLQGEPW